MKSEGSFEVLKVFVVGIPILIGALWLFSRLDESQRTQLRPADYDACIRAENVEFVQNCYRESRANDLKKSRKDVPVLPTLEERLKECKANLLGTRSLDKYYPDAGHCGKKPQ
jgi:hypothetical protein